MTYALPVALPLRTERLLLRTADEGDVDDLLGYRGDPDVCRHLPFDAQSRDDVVARMATWHRNAETDPADVPDEDWHLTLVAEHGDVVVGDVMLRLRAGHDRSVAEVGYVFAPAVGGRGLATEAVRAIVDAAFTAFGCHRVFALLDPRNAPSARLCERLGMTREAHLRRDCWSRGEWTDTAIYGLLRDEWDGGASTLPVG